MVGGGFTMAGGIEANYIASWDGSNWSPLGSGMNQYGYVLTLTVYDEKLIAGGLFTMVGNKVSAYIAQWTKGGAQLVGTISGIITDASEGTPIEGATISALQFGTTIGSSQSNSNGSYSILSLPVGTYDVVVSSGNYMPDTMFTVNVQQDNTLANFALIPASSEVVLTYGFGGSNDDGWDHYGTDCTWSLVSGAYQGYASGQSVGCYSIIGDKNWTDYHFRVNVKGIEGVDKMVVFRFQDTENHYALNLRSLYQGTQEFLLSRRKNGQSQLLTIVPYPNQMGVLYHLLISIFGSRIRVYVSGTKIIDYQDIADPIMNGCVGLKIWTGDEGVDRVEFDNVGVLTPSTNYHFQPVPNGWKFANTAEIMWPASYWEQFTNYGFPYTWPGCANPKPPRRSCIASAVFPDWPLFVDVFGRDQCYIGNTPNPIAVNKWRADARPYIGSCFGFAASAILTYDNMILPGYQNSLSSADHSQENVRLINGYFIHQSGKDFKEYRCKNINNPISQTLNDINQMFNNAFEHRFICLEGYDQNGGLRGHTVNPWKLESDGNMPNIRYIYVYDSQSPKEFDKKIKVDIASNKWWYDVSGLHLSREYGLFLSPPTSQLISAPVMPGLQRSSKTRDCLALNRLNDYVEILCQSNCNHILVNTSGENIGNIGDSVFSNITDGSIIFDYDIVAAKPTGFYVPKDSYTLTISQIKDSTYYFYIFGDSVSIFYERLVSDTTEIDNIGFSPADRSFQITNTQNMNKSFSLDIIISKPDSSLSIRIDSIALQPYDSIGVALLDNGDFEIANFGLNKNYNLKMNRITPQGASELLRYQIPLRQGDWQHLLPGWNAASLDTIRILIYHDVNGMPDDSLILKDQSFNCGDANGDTKLNLLDVSYIINYLYRHGAQPDPLRSVDVNHDGKLNLLDVSYIINYLYRQGTVPECP
jgi:archaellum component FlaF (FlaF/FlaG flagellin family)